MIKSLIMALTAVALTIGNMGCATRILSEGVATVTYTWTASGSNGGEIENYTIQSPANGLRTFSCDLKLSGAPSRVVA